MATEPAPAKAGDCYCYLPLYVFCGRHLLAAKLRKADTDASAGAKEEASRIVAHIRSRWPDTSIVLRADSGFAREEPMSWCEANGVDYVFGLVRNARLVKEIEAELAEAEAEARETGRPARRFKDFHWSTRDSWSRRRRVTAKAEWTHGEANPRFVVTSLFPGRAEARSLYEDIYCARGDMENRIKEAQGDLFADRTSARGMRANQLRLWFAAMAYVLLCALRRIALQGAALASACCATIRLRLLKIGARISISARRIRLAMASGFPLQEISAAAHGKLAAAIRARPNRQRQPAYLASTPRRSGYVLRLQKNTRRSSSRPQTLNPKSKPQRSARQVDAVRNPG
jgi:hypothetical protein